MCTPLASAVALPGPFAGTGNTFSNSSADALLARIFLFMRRSSCEKINEPIKAYQVKGAASRMDRQQQAARGSRLALEFIRFISKL